MIMIFFFFVTPRCSSSSRADTTTGCGSKIRIDHLWRQVDSAVWLYPRFPLSFREVDEMMLERGIVVSHETIRQWCAKFGQPYANEPRRRRGRPGDKWHVDEVFITINGQRRYLWRAVDQHGSVLDILVTSRRDAKAATRFFPKLLTGLRSVPRVLITDTLASYGAARRRVLRSVEHRQSK